MKILTDDKGTVATGEQNINDAVENLEPNGKWLIIEN